MLFPTVWISPCGNQNGRAKNDNIRIGWNGGATHEGDLKLIKGVIYRVLDKYPNVEVVIAPPLHLPGRRETAYPDGQVGDLDKYPAHLMRFIFDIGLPLFVTMRLQS